MDNFTTNVTLTEIIIEYNKNCKKGKNKKRLNNNSILLASIYNLLYTKKHLDDDKEFYKVFNITRTTISKFFNK